MSTWDVENPCYHISLTSGLAERATPEVNVETNAVITLNLHTQKRFQALRYGQPRRYLCTPRDGHEVCTSTSRQAVLQTGDGVDVTVPSAVPPWQCGAIMAARARSHSLSCGTEQLSAPGVRAAGLALARWHRRFYGDWGTALGEGHSHQRASSSNG